MMHKEQQVNTTSSMHADVQQDVALRGLVGTWRGATWRGTAGTLRSAAGTLRGEAGTLRKSFSDTQRFTWPFLIGVFVCALFIVLGAGFGVAPAAYAYSGSDDATTCFSLPEIVFGADDLEAAADLPDNEELFSQYIAHEYGMDFGDSVSREGSAAGASKKAASKSTKGSTAADSASALSGSFGASGSPLRLTVQKVTRGSLLGEQEKIVYDELSKRIIAIAAGKESSAIIDIPLETLGIQKTYTAQELGLDSIFDEQTMEIRNEARTAINNKFSVALMRILNAVLSDYPYELYWYDKTAGISFSPPAITATDNADGGAFTFARPWQVQFKMSISCDYSEDGTTGTYVTDTNKTTAAARAATVAQGIVSDAASQNDYDKLYTYLQAVAKLTDYDYSAADRYDATGAYGDPWQVIHVFDGDPDTRVVCEGYAKAFQYLCDLTSFSNPTIACNSVTGDMYGGTGSGPHMWNIVSIGGKNYLVDVTNNDNFLDDPEAISSTPNDELFLAGATGNVDEGYRIEWPQADGDANYWIYYYYDDELFYFFSEDELSLSAEPYVGDGSDMPGGKSGDDDDPAGTDFADKERIDKERADEVSALIGAIGAVEYTDACATAMAAARQAFDALRSDQQKLVKNYAALVNAETLYAALKADADAQHGGSGPGGNGAGGSSTGGNGEKTDAGDAKSGSTATGKPSTEKTGASSVGAAKMTPSIAGKTIKAKAKKKTVIARTKAFAIVNAGKVTFKIISGNRNIGVSKSGKVTVKKGLKKGKTYKVKVKVSAAADARHVRLIKVVTLKVKVK